MARGIIFCGAWIRLWIRSAASTYNSREYVYLSGTTQARALNPCQQLPIRPLRSYIYTALAARERTRRRRGPPRSPFPYGPSLSSLPSNVLRSYASLLADNATRQVYPSSRVPSRESTREAISAWEAVGFFAKIDSPVLTFAVGFLIAKLCRFVSSFFPRLLFFPFEPFHLTVDSRTIYMYIVARYSRVNLSYFRYYLSYFLFCVTWRNNKRIKLQNWLNKLRQTYT